MTQLEPVPGAGPAPRVTSDELQLPTERRLILAAERLFAERGVDAVSLRAINAAAGTDVASLPITSVRRRRCLRR